MQLKNEDLELLVSLEPLIEEHATSLEHNLYHRLIEKFMEQRERNREAARESMKLRYYLKKDIDRALH